MGYPYIPLIDADLVGFRCAAACKDDEPVEYCLHSVKKTMESIIDAFDRGLEFKAYLTGSDNYRHKLATIQPYKGNRVQEKPKYLADAREYLKYAWQAQVVEGREADDALGCAQWAAKDKSTCIVSIDKDMLTIPGWHYNYLKQEIRYVKLPEANKFFYTQVLTGDRSDNVLGVKGIGPKKAQKELDGLHSERDLYLKCLEVYNRVYGMDGERQLHENTNLLWIQREENKLWTKP